MAKEHSLVVKAIIKKYGNLPHSYLWPNQTGRAKIGGSYLPYGEKGSPDIIGCINGHFVGFEVKIGKDIWRDSQKTFSERIQKAGGCYFIVNSLAGFEEIYNSITF